MPRLRSRPLPGALGRSCAAQTPFAALCRWLPHPCQSHLCNNLLSEHAWDAPDHRRQQSDMHLVSALCQQGMPDGVPSAPTALRRQYDSPSLQQLPLRCAGLLEA